jgi:dolichol-phosphate mannosyltransferase
MPEQTPSDSWQNDWQVPAFKLSIFAEKRHAHALVIPVINEGERIRNQLSRIFQLRLPVDVIVTDGGSSDGSLDPAFLQANACRALLTKTGAGRLSAQLRVGYAWALDQGYQGIITVDGNGKDNVEAVPLFIERLSQGYDIVQGSRYIKGGQAINTPRDRWLAGRFIHAPLLSLAAGFWWTDTTNGFRGYSRTALLDARVQPFRDVFSDYNLLFYLSARIPRLGFRAVEVPVIRRYPDHGKIPTKISGIGGKVKMLRELLQTVARKFDPSAN